jgi:hypothetical protein
MYNSNIPNDRELPSTKKLIKSTILAAITAIVLLVTVVMPAEYGIDPTGIGQALGLKQMGEIKVSLAKEAATEEQIVKAAQTGQIPTQTLAEAAPVPVVASSVTPTTSAAIRTDERSVTLAPNEGTEIKVTLAKGKKVEYSWSSDGGRVNFDVHGDSEALNIDYHGYGKGSEQQKTGVIEAAFDGNHGWFWRNRTPKTLTVTLKTRGEYTDIKHMK